MIFKVVLDKKIHLIKLGEHATINDLKRSIQQAHKLQTDAYTLLYIDEEGDEITLNDQHDFAILTTSGQKNMKIKVIHSNEVKELINETEKIEIEEEMKPQQSSFMVQEGLIEEKLKKLLPGLVAKVKTEIEEEVSERSRIYDQNQPLIIEEEKVPSKKTESAPILQEVKPQTGKMETQQEKRGNKHTGVTCDNCGWNDIEGIRYKCAVCADFDFCERCEESTPHAHPFLKIRTVEQTPVKIIAVVRDQEDNLEVNGFKIPPQAGFENLLNRGMGFLSSMAGQQQQQQQQQHQGCPQGADFLRNMFQNFGQNFGGNGGNGGCGSGQRCQPDPRCEFFKNMCKNWQNSQQEKKEEKKMEEKEPTVNEDVIINNAQYLAQNGFDFTKCYYWAKTYPQLTKEQLLQLCLSSDKFLNSE